MTKIFVLCQRSHEAADTESRECWILGDSVDSGLTDLRQLAAGTQEYLRPPITLKVTRESFKR